MLINKATQLGNPHMLPLLGEELYRTDGCRERKNLFSPGMCPLYVFNTKRSIIECIYIQATLKGCNRLYTYINIYVYIHIYVCRYVCI